MRCSQHPICKQQFHPCSHRHQGRKLCPCMRRLTGLMRLLARGQQLQRQPQLWHQRRSPRHQWRPLPQNSHAHRLNLHWHRHQSDVCLTGLWKTLTTTTSTSPPSSATRLLGRLPPNSLKSCLGAKTKTMLRRHHQKMEQSTPLWLRMIHHQPRPHQAQKRRCLQPHHLPRRRSILLVACPRRHLPRTAVGTGMGMGDMQAAISASSGSLPMR